MKKEHWLYLVIVLIVIWIIASYATGAKKQTDDNSLGSNATTTTSVATTENKVAVSNQPAGNMVKLDSVSMTFDGWVVVHEDRDGKPGNILGAQRFDKGTYTSGQVELLRGTVAGGKYYVMLHDDDGDRVFDHTKDTPHMENGNTIVTTLVAQ